VIVMFPASKSCTVDGSMPAHRAAFTLLEICLTLVIGMVLILLAVPSVAGLLSEQRLHDSFIRFEQFANTARARSLQEQKPYRLLWDKKGVSMERISPLKNDAGAVDRLALGDGETFQVERVAALSKESAAEWTFWPNGTCEPVIISYRGNAGRWRVRFDALGARTTFLQSETL
jgi:Tfp pilus assembly protein FimT